MTVSALESAITGMLLSDAETAALLSDGAHIDAMLRVEAALARAEAEAGAIPAQAARRIAEVAATLAVAPESLAAGTAEAGVPVPALAAKLREAVGAEAADFVHWGATSQDIIDTALVLRLGTVLALFETRVKGLCAALADLAEKHRDTAMAARTRSQQAVPTSFGLKAAGWRAPLVRDLARLAELRPRLLVVSLGGAGGTLAALGDAGLAVEAAFARDLALGVAPLPWHTQRDAICELAGWLALVTGSLGKMADDIILLAQSEVGEVRAGAGGGSSTMPNKANPILPEALVALARFNAAQAGAVHQAMLQAHERAGPGWQLEWLTVPQMALATGAALRHAAAILGALRVDPARMRANLDASNGLVLAEAASFALARHMPRSQARALVEDACREVRAGGGHVIDILAKRCAAPVDWRALKDPANYLGAAAALIERALKETP